MTATTQTTPETGVTVQHLNPAELLVDVNVRQEARLDKDFIATIREHGVLQPIVAVRGEYGVRVRFGNRRTLAAIEAGRETVPVIVVGDERTDDAATVDRIVQQYVENEHRLGLTSTEKVGVAGQLAAFGLSAAQISRRIRMPKPDVQAALRVADSELASAAIARYDLTLDQAAVIAEFDGDPETVKALVVAARTGGFEHTAQRARDDRAFRAAYETSRDALTGDGVRVLESDEDIESAEYLGRLTDSEAGTQLTVADHAQCPGHAAILEQTWSWVADENAAGGSRQQQTWEPAWVCTDPAGHGHQERRATVTPLPQRVADMEPEEREEARAERRRVIENNQAWASAETVRREWLRTLAARKTAPKGTAAFLATALARHGDTISSLGGNHLAADLLGLTTTGYGRSQPLADLIESGSDARAQVIHLLIVLAAFEDATSREDWRTVQSRTSSYLAHLANLGYTLSNVEQLATGSAAQDAATA